MWIFIPGVLISVLAPKTILDDYQWARQFVELMSSIIPIIKHNAVISAFPQLAAFVQSFGWALWPAMLLINVWYVLVLKGGLSNESDVDTLRHIKGFSNPFFFYSVIGIMFFGVGLYPFIAKLGNINTHGVIEYSNALARWASTDELGMGIIITALPWVSALMTGFTVLLVLYRPRGLRALKQSSEGDKYV